MGLFFSGIPLVDSNLSGADIFLLISLTYGTLTKLDRVHHLTGIPVINSKRPDLWTTPTKFDFCSMGNILIAQQ